MERKQIPGTPFWIIGDMEKGYFLVMGNKRLTEPMGSKEAVEEYIEKNSYDIVLKMIIGVVTDMTELLPKPNL